jgi:hypothetical protein
MELTGDIGRRHDDDEGLLIGVYLGGKVAPFQPKLVQSVLDLPWVISLGHFIRCPYISRHKRGFLLFPALNAT